MRGDGGVSMEAIFHTAFAAVRKISEKFSVRRGGTSMSLKSQIAAECDELCGTNSRNERLTIATINI